MSVITVPVSSEQETFIKGLVKSGRAANKAHAVRMAITLLAQDEAANRLARAEKEIREGKVLKGDLRKLATIIE
ncbi:hypothetical protein H0X32_03985 [Patescibacteria group bacterium]|nr:hypothetical protein [Patescibacteria group bacterium]